MAQRSWVADQRWRLTMLAQIYRPVRGLFLLYLLAVLAGTLVESLALAAIVPLISPESGGSAVELFESALGAFGLELTNQNVVLVVGALFILRGIAQFAASLIAGMMVRLEAIRLQVDLFEGYLGLDWSDAVKLGQGELNLLLTTQAQQVAELLRRVADLIQGALYAVVLTAVALVVSPRYTLVAVVMVGTTAALVLAIGSRVRRHATELLARSKNQSSLLLQYARGALILRSFAVEQVAVDEVAEIASQRERVAFRSQRMVAFAGAFPDMIFVLALLGVISYSFSTGGGVAEVGAVVALLYRVSAYLKRFGEFSTIHQLIPALRDIRRHLARFSTHRAPDRQAMIDSDLESGAVVLEEVVVRYGDATADAVASLTNRIEPGEFVGVIGPSGGGKSSLVMAMSGLLQTSSGTIRMGIGGLQDLALVPQVPFILTGTLASNVRWFRHMDDETVRQACSRAGLDSLLARLPAGIETEVEQEGLSLSGGERQRLAMARALAGDPKVLLLDEATSALDSESERAIQEALDAMRGSTTILAVAHRLSTVLNADRIWVMEHGVVGEDGPPQVLLRDRSSRFAKFGALQGLGDGHPT